jgi:hypothetical protein
MPQLTQLLMNLDKAQPSDMLLPLVYDELRQLAAQKLANEHPGHTLQPTALVHEAYLRLMGPADAPPLGESCPLLRCRRPGHASHSDRRSTQEIERQTWR